jgi:hemerythrin-like domain-containing protein
MFETLAEMLSDHLTTGKKRQAGWRKSASFPRPMEQAMAAQTEAGKRNFLKLTTAGAAGIAAALIVPSTLTARPASKPSEKEAEVTPPEDLMREHGVLDRLLLIYEAGIRKFASNEDFDPAVITRSAEIVRDFIENYHERSEEEAVFPRFRKAGKMLPLVDTLLAQHQAGRRVTQSILQYAPGSRKDGDDRHRLEASIQSFITMYRPHAAREDTDLFPMLRSLVSAHEYDAMAEDFENKEHRLFGEDGFEKMVQRVAALEQTIGINDLAQFTPR